MENGNTISIVRICILVVHFEEKTSVLANITNIKWICNVIKSYM